MICSSACFREQAIWRSPSIVVQLPLSACLSMGSGGDVEASLHVVSDGGQTNLQAGL